MDGVYLVGGGTHPGSGLPVIFESARISSKLVLEDLGVNGGNLVTPEKPVANTHRSGNVMADAVQTFARLLNLKPAPIVNDRTPDSSREP